MSTGQRSRGSRGEEGAEEKRGGGAAVNETASVIVPSTNQSEDALNTSAHLLVRSSAPPLLNSSLLNSSAPPLLHSSAPPRLCLSPSRPVETSGSFLRARTSRFFSA